MIQLLANTVILYSTVYCPYYTDVMMVLCMCYHILYISLSGQLGNPHVKYIQRLKSF